MERNIVTHRYFGERAITMVFGAYRAMILPDCGGNLVAFDDVDRELRFLRTPQEHDMDLFKRAEPFVYGMPVLFPPNRYEDGTFTLNNRRYNLPLNDESTHNHLHGLFYDIPWMIANTEISDTKVSVELRQQVDEGHSVYQYFPHRFTMAITYTLSSAGLQQAIRVHNTGVDSMPCLLAFHTTLNVPFARDSRVDDYTFMATVGERWELTPRKLPTNRYQELSESEEHLKSDGISPFVEPMDNHYTSLPQDGQNFATLTDNRLRVRLVYDVGLKYKQWMIFNNYGKGEFICPEPQTSVVNAPNTGLSHEESGVILLSPGDDWSETSRLYLEEI